MDVEAALKIELLALFASQYQNAFQKITYGKLPGISHQITRRYFNRMKGAASHQKLH